MVQLRGVSNPLGCWGVGVSSEAIEVLLKNKAYVIKRCHPECENPISGQITWGRFGGPASAWLEALQRSGILSDDLSTSSF